MGKDSVFTLGILGVVENYPSVVRGVPPMVSLPLFATDVIYEYFLKRQHKNMFWSSYGTKVLQLLHYVVSLVSPGRISRHLYRLRRM